MIIKFSYPVVRHLCCIYIDKIDHDFAAFMNKR